MVTALTTSLSSRSGLTTSKRDDRLPERMENTKFFVNPARNEKPMFVPTLEEHSEPDAEGQLSFDFSVEP